MVSGCVAVKRVSGASASEWHTLEVSREPPQRMHLRLLHPTCTQRTQTVRAKERDSRIWSRQDWTTAGKSPHRRRRVEICLVENRGGGVYTAALSERLMDAEPVFTMLFCAARGAAMTSSASATQDLASSSLCITLLCASSSPSADFANVTVVEWSRQLTKDTRATCWSPTRMTVCMHTHACARVCSQRYSTTRQRAAGKQPTHRKTGEAPASTCMLFLHF